MKQRMKELQKLKGVGEILSRRLVEAGHDTFAKVAATGESGLKKIRGINPIMIQPILAQAKELLHGAEQNRTDIVKGLKHKTDIIKVQVQEISLNIRERFKYEIAGKVGRKLEKSIVKVISSLESVEGQLERKVKKSAKGLVKAETHLSSLVDARFKKIGKGLRKARQSLKRVYA